MAAIIKYFAREKSSYLSNELRWLHVANFLEFEKEAKSVSSLSNASPVLVFLCGNNLKELEIIRSFPKDSIWVDFYADEVYSPKLNYRALSMDSVKGLIRPYWNHHPMNTQGYFQYLKESFCKYDLLEKFLLTKLLLSGLVILNRQWRIRLASQKYKKNIIKIPLGYTNSFASIFELMQGYSNCGSSLLERRLFSQYEEREILLSFVGQEGNVQRTKLISSLEKMTAAARERPVGQVIIFKRQKFGGTLGSYGATEKTVQDFIQCGLKAKFGLCPPGNYSGETFRYSELLCMGTFPLECKYAVSDPSFFRGATIPTIFADLNTLEDLASFSGETRWNTVHNLILNEIKEGLMAGERLVSG